MISPAQLSRMHNPSCFLYGPGTAKIEDQPVPELTDPHEVLVRIRFIGVCGSDVHFWRHGGIQTPVTKPLVMGHEASGTIAAVGPAVTRLKAGDCVAIEPGHPCRRCERCKDGRYNLCPRMRFAAAPPDVHGTLCKFWKAPEDFVHRIDGERVGLQEAVLIEPLAVAVHTARLADIRPGQTVVVTGANHVMLLDISKAKVAFASEYLGVETYLLDVNATAEASANAVASHFDLQENQVDAVIEASGAEPSIQLGIYLVKPGGSYVQTGLGQPKPRVPMLALSEKELHVSGCFRYGPGDFSLAVKVVEGGLVDLKPLISSITPLERATEAWDTTGRGEGIKNLIEGVLDEGIS